MVVLVLVSIDAGVLPFVAPTEGPGDVAVVDGKREWPMASLLHIQRSYGMPPSLDMDKRHW